MTDSNTMIILLAATTSTPPPPKKIKERNISETCVYLLLIFPINYSKKATLLHSILSRTLASAKLPSQKAVCGVRQPTPRSLS